MLERARDGWVVPPAATAKETGVSRQPDGSLLITRKARKNDALRVALQPAAGWVAALRLELLPHERHQGAVTRNGADSSLVQLAATLEPAKGKETRLAFRDADADHKEPRYRNGDALIGVKEGWKTSAGHAKEPQTSVWLLDTPVQLGEGDQLVVTLKSDNLGCVRLAVSPFAAADPRQPVVTQALAAALGTPPSAQTTAQRDALHEAYFLGTGWDAEAFARFRTLQAEVRDCRDGKAFTMVTEAWEPRPMRVLPRGNWQDESGAVVVPAVPQSLPQPADAAGRRLTRLDLARWLVAPENPLTARVFVNRLWKQFFGTGISGVVEDVGAQGEWPTHPELLDWLAVEFRESGWDVKHVVKLIVLSSTYRQDSKARPELKDADPNNRLLAYHPPRRLEAESVRDNALAVAGLLVRDVGGPSARPYQPAGYYANLQFPNRDYVPHADDRQYRRGLYTHWQRTFLHPMLANFDAPSREECTASRTAANTPQQALTLLNDPSFVEAARVLAERALAAADTDEARLSSLYQQVLARPAKAKERESLLAFLSTVREVYRRSPEDAARLLRTGLAPVTAGADEPEQAAWTNLCRVVLNLHETITRY